MSGVIDTITGRSGRDAARASMASARMLSDAQLAGLDYLKETDALPRQLREGALQQLAGLYGRPG